MFNHGLDVYRGVGKAFAAFMANDEVQRQFQTYIIPNKAAAPVAPSFNTTVANTSGGRACWSLGYANVSLGRSLFAEYAEGRLARVALDRLLRGHRENVVDVELRRDDVMIQERVEQAKFDFFKASGLYELGSENNQVLDALRSIDDKKARLNRFGADALAALRSNRSKTTPAEWLKVLTTTVDAHVREFETAEDRDRAERAQSADDPERGFVPMVQTSLLNATAMAAGRYGLPVTIGLIDILDTQMKEAANELEQDRDKYQQEEKGFLSRARSVFQQLRDRQIDSSHTGFEAAVKDRREALRRRTEATLYDFAAKLLREISENVLPSLRSALEKAERTLRRGEEEEYRTIVEQWSAYDVPAHLRAAPNELLLEGQDTFPRQLDRLLAATFKGSGGAAAASRRPSRRSSRDGGLRWIWTTRTETRSSSRSTFHGGHRPLARVRRASRRAQQTSWSRSRRRRCSTKRGFGFVGVADRSTTMCPARSPNGSIPSIQTRPHGRPSSWVSSSTRWIVPHPS